MKKTDVAALLSAFEADPRGTSEKVMGELFHRLVPGSFFVVPHPEQLGVGVFGEILNNESDTHCRVRIFSVDCKQGEEGILSKHKLIPITQLLYEHAKSLEWNLTSKDALTFTILAHAADEKEPTHVS